MHTSHPTHWSRVFLLWGCGILAAMQFAKISLTFSILQAQFGVSPAQMGWVLSMVGVVGLSLGVSMGLLAPRVGYRRLLTGGLVLGAVLAGVQTLDLPFGWFFATRVLEGASHLSVVVAAPTLMAGAAGPAHRSVAMGLWSTFVGTAFALCAAFGQAFLMHFSVYHLFALHAALLLLAAVCVWCMVPADPARVPEAARGSLLARHVRIYTHWATAMPGLCFFCYTGLAVALLTFLPRGLPESQHGVAAVLPFVGMAGTFGAGWLTRRRHPMQLLQWIYPAMGLSGMACAFAAYSEWGYTAAALLLMGISGLAGGTAFALIPALNKDAAQQARANGAVAQMGNLGATLGPPTFALALSHQPAWGLAMPVVVLAALGWFILRWGQRHQALAAEALTAKS
ncbi:MFS transporter [Rhodoferax bucti]|uniref:MFS transporter n=1 Tax=Rhodoferax bucti TaxID=2576305 RepID=UPI00147775FC|nr:MFS transporter [Rhodoferax bucti]